MYSRKIRERAVKTANIMIDMRLTIRDIAKKLGVSKSTVHKDLVERLPQVDRELFHKVRDILDYHIAVRHLRGGQSTYLRWKRVQ